MKTLALITTLAAALGLTACGGNGEGGDPATSTVEVRTFSFEPDPITVDAGTEVTWRNSDGTTHTVTTGPRGKPDGLVDLELSPSDGEARATFDRPGTYRYFCSLHSGPGMEASVIVE